MLENNSLSRTFLGIRFVLYGLDPLAESKARSKLTEGGGVDVHQYSQDCTHVIVDNIVYDDPICVVARNGGKTLVTGLWVDHSVDIGMPVDVTSIIYRPRKDLNGIPGAKNLIMCLTGYQRQDREDIMTMVGLMGAQFSKPLVANKVTHLICYKFEGEKYELANKLKRIKLVNHRWLEDCLREWELIPEDNYSKSGYEMEMMEVEAKDSEDDGEAQATTKKQSSIKNGNKSPQSLKLGTPKGSELSKSVGKMPKTSVTSTEAQVLSNFVNSKDVMATPGKKNKSNHVLGFDAISTSANPGCLDAGSLNDAISVDLPDQRERTPKSLNLCNDLGSAPRTVIRPLTTDAKSCTSYSRKKVQKSPSLIFSVDSGNVRKSKVDLDERSLTSYAKKSECAEDLLSSPSDMPLNGSELPSEDPSNSKKRKIDVSFPCSKPHKSPHAWPLTLSSPSVISDGLASASIVDGFPKIDHHSLNATRDCSMHDARNFPANTTAKSAKFVKKSFTGDPSFCEKNSLEGEQNEHVDKKKLRTYSGKTLVGELDGVDLDSETSEHMAVKTGVQQIQLQDKGVAHTYDKSSETEKCETHSTMGKLQVANDNSSEKPIKKTTVTKKTLGSRSKLENNRNQKCSIYANNVTAEIDAASLLAGLRGGADAASILAVEKEGADTEKVSCANELEKLPLTVNVATMEERETNIVRESGSDLKDRTDMDDKTEAPDENDECVNLLIEERNELVDLSLRTNDKTIKKSEEVLHGATSSASGIHRDTKKGKIVAQEQKKEEPVSEKICENGNKRRGKKQSSGKIKTNTANRVSQVQLEVLDKEGTGNGMNTDDKENNKPSSQVQAKGQTLSSMKSEDSRKEEKENKPVHNHQNSNPSKGKVHKRPAKSNKQPMKIDTSESNCNRTKVRESSKQVKAEPVCFILSGHRIQRKEFQQVIRRLKGRFCRDSHNWSYQATHLIVPDIRRTEKFFAAAASGRWILKTDYLTACSQAGKFLAEEPYEWHKTGLNEDGTINLEGPRKWRLLRERTGHGALYGMRIVIYGECITPPLDTLKRVVKAGDGTILATSPPYTRFLASGVDFAIVSAGMPRVDIWVQEFLKHEIPCVLADYLVEYVCKPGFSLERHVLYNTNAWADKSFANLLMKSEEVVDELTTSDESCSNDTACQVCGSHDREEVMLICGDASGSVGCGEGMHIDCCDPPLADIPEEDWFCPKCSKIKDTVNHPKKKQKGSSSKTSN